MAMITIMRHFLDEDDDIPKEIPGPALKLALFLGAIVAWVTIRKAGQIERTNVPCRKSTGRRRCEGIIYAMMEADKATIAWECPICGECGSITGWEGTQWDRRRG